MKKLLLACLLAATVFSCKKTENVPSLTDSYIAAVSHALHDSLSSTDYATLDFSHAVQTHVYSAGIHLLRIPLSGKNIANDFLVVKTNAEGIVQKGSFISISRTDVSASSAVKAPAGFNGSISYRSLKGNTLSTKAIINGHIQKTQTATVTTNAVGVNMMAEYDAELPEVIVYSSYSDAGISWGDWYNLLAMIGAGDGGGGSDGSNYYTPGGGAGSSAPAVQVDFEAPETKQAIDVKKYINCFGASQEASATYTITIATDIPVDNDPSKFFNWNDASPGHSYIELYKNGNNGLISQNIGFYPNTSWKAATGGNIASKIADDAGHEYNARYTISVSASQFQAALSAVQTYSSYDYNISGFNCTDFALDVFNAAGGGLSIPQYQIPGFPNGSNGSNTPQGLYNQLQNMSVAGTQNIQTNANKAYGGTSHGPCN